MLMMNVQKTIEKTDSSKAEFYKLIGEGYQAMQEGRTSTIEEVKEKINLRRKELG